MAAAVPLEAAKFLFKERVPVGQQDYSVKGMMTMFVAANKRVMLVEFRWPLSAAYETFKISSLTFRGNLRLARTLS